MIRSADPAKYPWMKFYPADWRADPALRMCSLAARGLWMEMLSIMHEAAPRGSLLINGKNVGSKQLASLCGAAPREIVALLTELETAGVFSRTDDGTIFSRRMKRDDEKAARDKANGKTGGNPNLTPKVNPPLKAQTPDARNPEARIQKPKKMARASALPSPWIEADRERFWAAFPNKVGKAEAMRAFDRASKKVTPEVLFPALHRYANKTDDRPFCNPATWLNQERWLDQPAVNANGRRSYSSPRRPSGTDFLTGMRRLAADIAGNGQARGSADPDIPFGTIDIDG